MISTSSLMPTSAKNQNEVIQTLAMHGKTFYWASFFLTNRQAHAAAELYACCRALDDLADSTTHSSLSKQQTLQHLKEAIQSPDMVSDLPLASAIRALIEEHAVPPAALLSLLDGMISDTEHVALTNKHELDRYCFRVAGTVGLMMCPILGVTDTRALPFAIDLGIAMQLTNICRDVLEDAELGRRYLPADVTPVEIRFASDSIRIRVQQTVADQLLRAESFYHSGLRGLAYLPRSSRIAIFIAANLYRAIGRKLRRNNYAWWGGRTVISPLEKVGLILRLLPDLFCILVRPTPRMNFRHAPQLHANLDGLPHVDHPS